MSIGLNVLGLDALGLDALGLNQCSKLSAASKFSQKPTNGGPENALGADQKPTFQDPWRGLIEIFLSFFIGESRRRV